MKIERERERKKMEEIISVQPPKGKRKADKFVVTSKNKNSEVMACTSFALYYIVVVLFTFKRQK